MAGLRRPSALYGLEEVTGGLADKHRESNGRKYGGADAVKCAYRHSRTGRYFIFSIRAQGAFSDRKDLKSASSLSDFSKNIT
jgi:hypothetical protein